MTSDDYQSLFHATKENQAALETLYGVKFENPPLSGRDKVIEALQTSNGKPVVCLVKHQEGVDSWFIRAIGSFSDGCFYSQDKSLGYCDAKPLSPDEYVIA